MACGLITWATKHAAQRAQGWVRVEEVEVASQLLHAVDLAPPLDLDGHRTTIAIAAEQVDGTDLGGMLAPDKRQPWLDPVACGQQL